MSEQGSGASAPEGYDTLVCEHGAARVSSSRPAGPVLQQADQKIASLVHELAKAYNQEDLTTLEAPVDGTVQQLAIHTVGGVVTPAQPLMIIVPQDQPVEVEAMLENKDIGFVHPGQSVTFKVKTFTGIKYGNQGGTVVVVSVSRDAIEDEKRGLIYSSKICLERYQLNINGQDIKLIRVRVFGNDDCDL